MSTQGGGDDDSGGPVSPKPTTSGGNGGGNGGGGNGGPSVRLNLSSTAATTPAAAAATAGGSASSSSLTQQTAPPTSSLQVSTTTTTISTTAATLETEKSLTPTTTDNDKNNNNNNKGRPTTTRGQSLPPPPSSSSSTGGGGRGGMQPPANKRQRLSSSSPPAVAPPTSAAIGSGSAAGSSDSTFFVPTASMTPHVAEASQVSVVHQSTHLSWMFDTTCTQQWFGEGKTTLFVIHHHGQQEPTTTNNNKSVTTNQSIQHMALHLRGCVELVDVKLEAMVVNNTNRNNKKNYNTNKQQQPRVSLQSQKVTFLHADPLERVLLKPAASYEKRQQQQKDNEQQQRRCEADAQCSRGAAGMTNGLRAASIASWQGEIRLSYQQPDSLLLLNDNDGRPPPGGTTTTTKSTTKDDSQVLQQLQQDVERAWQVALQQEQRLASGTAKLRLQTQLRRGSGGGGGATTSGGIRRSPTTNVKDGGSRGGTTTTTSSSHSSTTSSSSSAYHARIQLCSQRLAAASCGEDNNNNNEKNHAFRLTIKFRLPSHPHKSLHPQHYGGLHILTHIHPPPSSGPSSTSLTPSLSSRTTTKTTTTNTNNLLLTRTITPHIYTTSGIYGDHEGPRCWMPCLDSAMTKHRASHELTIVVTAPMKLGLSTIGMGQETMGLSQAYLHTQETVFGSGSSSRSKKKNSSGSNNNNREAALLLLGADHMTFLQRTQQQLLKDKEEKQKEQQQQQQQVDNEMRRKRTTNQSTLHVIPPDSSSQQQRSQQREEEQEESSSTRLSMNDISVTHIWCSASWAPIPIRSLGFAIGPFRILEDDEYFASSLSDLSSSSSTRAVARVHGSNKNGMDDDDDDDEFDDSDEDDDDSNNEVDDNVVEGDDGGGKNNSDHDNREEGIGEGRGRRRRRSKSWEDSHARSMQTARERGEGIRQAYLAPVFLRKHLFAQPPTQSPYYSPQPPASRVLLPNGTRLALRDLTNEQKILLQQMDQTIQWATVGVPHRALSLMRDLLALPTYRTASYIQIWIPNAIHGGCTSGALHQCPEVLVNPFLGGAILDARLLPPIQTRLPYYNGIGDSGGRVLQFLQARNAVRGWITASLPLGGGGGGDEVGHGYILRLFESLLMSCYERGHGAVGEGGGRDGVFCTRRYAQHSGLNSTNLDFLPIHNMWDDYSMMMEGFGGSGGDGGGGDGGMMMDGGGGAFVPPLGKSLSVSLFLCVVWSLEFSLSSCFCCGTNTCICVCVCQTPKNANTVLRSLTAFMHA